MGRKSQTKDSDMSEIRRLKIENQKLKRENSRLKKMVRRHEDYHEDVVEFADEAPAMSPKQLKKESDALLNQWKCFACSKGTLLLLVIERPDGKFFKRKCSECNHSTRLKPHTPDVKGITNAEFKELASSQD